MADEVFFNRMMSSDPRETCLLDEVAEVRARAREAKLLPGFAGRRPSTSARGVLVIAVVRDECHRLAEFLRHYRSLGVRRFVIVDNESTDGSREFLSTQPDVDLWLTQEVFSPLAKHAWINWLIAVYGRERWYLLADADEHVVYAEAAYVPLETFASRLFEEGARQARGMLVDMYAAGAALAVFRRPREAMLDAFPLFDTNGYHELRLKEITSRQGGPRARAFENIAPAFRPELTKYPLFWPGSDGCMTSPHYNWPRATGREDVCRLGILHFKFDGDSLSRVSNAAASGRYWRLSFEYRVYRDALRANPGLAFDAPVSRRYMGPECLVLAGLIEAAPRDGQAPNWAMVLDAARRVHYATKL